MPNAGDQTGQIDLAPAADDAKPLNYCCTVLDTVVLLIQVITMKSCTPKEVLAGFRRWSGTIDELAVLATMLTQTLELEPDPTTTAKSYIAPRTIRYYITRGLVSPAQGQTRNAVYTYSHLLELLYIKCLQKQGLNLEAIRESLQGKTAEQLEATVLREAPARTKVPLPSHADLFKKYHQTTARNHWARTAPCADESSSALDGQKDVSETRPLLPDAPLSLKSPLADPGILCSPARTQPDDTDHGAHFDRELTHRVHIKVVNGVELVVTADHRLAQDPAYRRQLVARLRQWLRRTFR